MTQILPCIKVIECLVVGFETSREGCRFGFEYIQSQTRFASFRDTQYLSLTVLGLSLVKI